MELREVFLQPHRISEGWCLHCTQWMFYYLGLECCEWEVSFQGSGVMGGQCVLGIIHDSLIIISHHGVSFVAFPITVMQSFEWWLSAGGRTSACGSMLMLRMRQRKSLTRQWLCWASWEDFQVLSAESCQLLVGEYLICLLGRYHQLFYCKVYCYSTSIKVQDVGQLNLKVPDVWVTLGSPSCSQDVSTKAVIAVPILLYWSSVGLWFLWCSLFLLPVDSLLEGVICILALAIASCYSLPSLSLLLGLLVLCLSSASLLVLSSPACPHLPACPQLPCLSAWLQLCRPLYRVCLLHSILE